MGVKDLWTIVSSVREECSLSALAGRTLAVDLSCWVCEACTAKGLSTAVQKPHLRTLYFRILSLYRLGASLVFVVDGEATQLKWETMERRERGRGGSGRGEGYRRMTGNRTQLNSKIRECCELLHLLGVPYLQSKGEAEALCALLNSTGVVDGVLTQDSDVFLYGARVVYKDLSTSEKDSKVDCYKMDAIEKDLGLTRHTLVSLALLLGCDYCPQGVPGVGKERALKLIGAARSCDKSCDLLDRFRIWKKGRMKEDQLLGSIERQVREKALTVPGFPNERVISEFLVPKDSVPSVTSSLLQWRMPQMARIQVAWSIGTDTLCIGHNYEVESFCHEQLEWPCEYSHDKSLPLLTQWVMREVARRHTHPAIIRPLCILRQRVRHGVPCFEVRWEGDGTVQEREGTDDTAGSNLTTLETAQQFESTFPEICAEFRLERELAKKQRKVGQQKKKSKHTENSERSPDLSEALAKQLELPEDISHTQITDDDVVIIGTTDDIVITGRSSNTHSQWDCIRIPLSQECPLSSTTTHERKSHQSQAAREPSQAVCKRKNKLRTEAEKQKSCIHMEPQETQRQVEQKATSTVLPLLGDTIELEPSDELPPELKSPRFDTTTTSKGKRNKGSSQSRSSNVNTTTSKEEKSSLPEIVESEPSEELPPEVKSPKLDSMTKRSSQSRSSNSRPSNMEERKTLTLSEGIIEEQEVERASFPETEEIIELDSTSLEELPLFARLLYKEKQKSTSLIENQECSNSINSVSETDDCVVTSPHENSCTSFPPRRQSRHSCGSAKTPIIID